MNGGKFELISLLGLNWHSHARMLFLHPIALGIIGILHPSGVFCCPWAYGPWAAENTLRAENTNDPSSKGCKNLPIFAASSGNLPSGFHILRRYLLRAFSKREWEILIPLARGIIGILRPEGVFCCPRAVGRRPLGWRMTVLISILCPGGSHSRPC